MRALDQLDWDDLKVFVHAARGGSLAGAAKRLRVDQSTVSRRLAHLEAALGVSLFERVPSGLRLSEAGQRLLRHAERVESAIIAMEEEVTPGSGQAGGRVRLATMEGIASLYLAERFVCLHETHPHLTVELLTSSQTVYVNRREADLFLSFFKPPGQGLVSERIGRFRLGLYASPGYLDRAGTPQSIQDLERHAFVTYVEDLVQVDCVRWLDEIIADRRTVFHSTSMIAQKQAAAGGLGIVLLPSFAVTSRDLLVPVLHDDLSTTRDLWLNVHTDLQFSPRIRAVSAFLKTLFRSDSSLQVDLRHSQPVSALGAPTSSTDWSEIPTPFAS
ncbi:LysR family transcriptional regulator [Methylobacterium sp. E-065]|uniref:LysR family transcriptional regulator n=1 Tax=Methylobacterium sp. E-065 TaxID=2836583 RepID=UPI001FB9E607|nr:LysR family transcriptional regulator [Methylobacterium sp. E-065]MCJ2017072.1 LysR family transcriptional regulator [Methylobacterium sp. E-065]